jgi:exo-beta-1,3-glucanase (GH17 family)
MASAAGIHVDALLEDWVTADTPSAFAKLGSDAVARLKPLGVETYEVLNEVNDGSMSASTYTGLLRSAYASIKKKDHAAVVLEGADGTGSYAGEPIDYLKAMYDAGALGFFDAGNMHPYSYPDTPSQTGDSWNPWSYLTTLHQVMADHGDGAKPIWLTEFGCPTGSDGGYPADCTDSSLAQQITDAFRSARGLAWAGPLFVYDWRDDGSGGDGDFGLYSTNGSPKARTVAAYRAAARG